MTHPTLALRTAVLLAAALAGASGARAAHPIQTEDTGTQGAGNLELENGFSRERDADARGTVVAAWQPQLSIGLAPTLDAIVQPAWVSRRARGADTAAGTGDTNLDAKWRFYGADPWSLAVRAGLELPTARAGLGLAHGRLGEHALLAATWDAAPTTVHVNAGASHALAGPGVRATAVVVSAAVLQAIDERLLVTVDGQFTQDPSPARRAWPGDVLAGAIWTLRPGLDVDLGYEAGINARPSSRSWLAGLTWRFAL